MPFLSKLEYEPAEGTNIWGRPQYRLTAPLVYSYNDEEFTVPAGFKTDFATIPNWIPLLRPKNGKWAKASVVHDHLCKTKDLPKGVADRIFYYAMLDDEASIFTAWLFWLCVRSSHIVTLQG